MAIQGVAVKAVDPFAAYHAPIQGKKHGNLTVLGKIGICVGALMFFAGVASTISSGNSIELLIALFGIVFSVASYLWARK